MPQALMHNLIWKFHRVVISYGNWVFGPPIIQLWKKTELEILRKGYRFVLKNLTLSFLSCTQSNCQKESSKSIEHNSCSSHTSSARLLAHLDNQMSDLATFCYKNICMSKRRDSTKWARRWLALFWLVNNYTLIYVWKWIRTSNCNVFPSLRIRIYLAP